MNSPLLSIIIPTRNRYKTLIPVIESIMELNKSEIELIIQDNSDDNTVIKDYLLKSKYFSLKYFYTSNKISMVENTELAIVNASGKYFIFIGDDDIVNPKIVEIVQYMDKNLIYCLIYPIANYFYKDVIFNKEYGFNKPATLSFNKEISCYFISLNTKDEIARVADSGAIYILDLPRLYHGIVKKEIIYQIKNTFGKFVPGPCPDMTLSTSLALILEKFHKINIPLSVAGNSSISEGGKGPTNQHIVKLEDKDWLNQNDILDWNENIPRIFSRETIWAQSFYHVLSLKKVIDINYITLYNNMLFSCPKIVIKYIKPLYKKLKLPLWRKYKSLFLAFLRRYFRILLFSLPSSAIEVAIKLRGDFNHKVAFNNVTSIKQCMNLLGTYTSDYLNNDFKNQ